MSKPGGKPIVKKRPFFDDEKFSIGSNYDDSGRITSFYFIDKERKNEKIFAVTKNEIQRAWQELEKHADPIAASLLKKGYRPKKK